MFFPWKLNGEWDKKGRDNDEERHFYVYLDHISRIVLILLNRNNIKSEIWKMKLNLITNECLFFKQYRRKERKDNLILINSLTYFDFLKFLGIFDREIKFFNIEFWKQ